MYCGRNCSPRIGWVERLVLPIHKLPSAVAIAVLEGSGKYVVEIFDG